MRRITEAIEYTPTVIYLHYEDKDTLIRELCREDSISLAKTLHCIANEPNPLERLRRIGIVYVDFGIGYRDHDRLMFMTSHKPDSGSLVEIGHENPKEDSYAFIVVAVAEAIEKAPTLRSDLQSPHLIAQAHWAAVRGVVAPNLTKKGDRWVDWRSLKTAAVLVIDAMIDGFKRKG